MTKERMIVEPGDWSLARKALRRLGVRVKTSINACCPGCIDNEKEKIVDDEPLIFSIRSRFDSDYGGVLYHQNIAGTDLAEKVDDVLFKFRIHYQWDRSGGRAILVDLDEGPRREWVEV